VSGARSTVALLRERAWLLHVILASCAAWVSFGDLGMQDDQRVGTVAER
jgi:hypothetical protein